MKSSKKLVLVRLTALLLVVCMVAPCYASAAVIEPVMPVDSDYFDSSNAFISAMGGGRIEIWFSITADNVMDEIGALSIRLYESADGQNWTRVSTFLHENRPGMLVGGEYAYSSCVSYYGIPGRQYKAHLSLWAGRNGNGEVLYTWTQPERA